MGGLVVVGIGFAILPTVKNITSNTINSSNLTGGSETLLSLVPLAFMACLCVIAILMAYQGLKSSGIIGEPDEEISYKEDSDDSDKDEEDGDMAYEEPKKITSELIKPKKNATSSYVTISNEEVEPIIIKCKNKFEVKSKYE